MNFLFIYLGEKKGCTNTCIYMEHIVSLVLFFFSARSVQGRFQGGAKIGHGGQILQQTSSSDWKATATNRMHSNDLEACGM